MIKLKHIKKGFPIVATIVFVNLVNMMFNIYMGHKLSFQDLSTIALFNSFSYLFTVAFTALYSTVNSQSAKLHAKFGGQSSTEFLYLTKKKFKPIGLILSVVWLALAHVISSYFQTTYIITLLFTPIILLGFLTYANEGYLHGRLKFGTLSLIIAIEVISKLSIGVLIVSLNYSYFVVAALPASAIIAFILSNRSISHENYDVRGVKTQSFPSKFFVTAGILGLASMAYLTLDVLLAKHYFTPHVAGQYALLALIGKMIYFFGVLPNIFLLTLISREVGLGRNPIRIFYIILSTSASLLLMAYLGVMFWGSSVLPLLFGVKVVEIFPYLNTYMIAIVLFALSGAIGSYHLARLQYQFSYFALSIAALMVFALIIHHQSIQSFINVLLWTSFLSLLTMVLMHVVDFLHIYEFKAPVYER